MRGIAIGLSALTTLMAAGLVLGGVSLPGTEQAHSAETAPALFGFGLIGLVLAGLALNVRRVLWLACVPTGIGAFALFENLSGLNPSFAPWLAGLLSGETAPAPGRMPTIAAAALLLVGSLLGWVAARIGEKRRLFGFAMTGSFLGAVGLTTLAGYAVNVPMACRWGSSVNLPPVVAVAMLLMGAALLAYARGEHYLRNTTTPTWLPIPVIAAFGTFTIIFWAGQRERETAYLDANTQIAGNTFAGNINLEFERQVATLERMARRWAAESSPAVWESDAAAWLPDAPGANALFRVSRGGETVWHYPPEGNESLVSFNHFSERERRATLEAVALGGTPLATGTLKITGRGQGFVIYAPIYRASVLAGYIGAEFTYQNFFGALDRRLKLSPDHRCAVYLGPDRVYASVKPGTPSHESARAVESVFTLQNRRMRTVIEPSDEYLRSNRRYLPEISLAAGLGITLLLGLTTHLARAALANLGAAESTNRLLRDENAERRRVEELLKVSDERLRLALDATSIGIFEWDCTANTLHCGAGLRAMLGLGPDAETMTPEAWLSLVHPADLPAYQAVMHTQLNGSLAFIDPEYRVRTGVGQWRWLYMRSKTVACSDFGAPVRIVGTLQDVTARREAEEALRSSQAAARKLSLVASRTDNLVLIVTPEGEIEWVNESFERVMEYSLQEVVGRNPASFMNGPDTDPHTARRIKNAITRGEGISTDIVKYSKSGRKYHLQLEIQPVRNEHGVLENFIAIEADITARVETENALRQAKSEADDASRAKSEFLASMSHEIRTPMNGVIGMTSLLLETPLNQEQRDSVNTIRTSGDALLAIINDLLDFSKIESGKLELEHRPFEIAGCVEDTLDLFTGQAASRRIELAHHIEPNAPPLVLGDVNRLRQVLSNLINNAIKFTQQGRVTVTVSLASSEAEGAPLRPNHALLAITVEDSGIGIPADRLDRLFKPFSQVDASTTRKYGGTGLGLVICRRLCELMGGDIRVRSAPGQGSTFTFTVQVEAVPGGKAPANLLPTELSSGYVLCIDDNPASLRRLTAFFETSGVRVRCAADAGTAAGCLAHSPPALAVLDLDLPASEALHESLLAAKIPVLGQLVTAAAAPPEWTRRARFVALPRPLRTAALARALHTLLKPISPDTAPVTVRETPVLATEIPLDVLLVEDNPVNQKVALRFLQNLGYRADAVANGIEAVNAVGARPYQLVFMDLQMPEMDGLEATRRIRQNLPAHRQPCIIALTANALPSDREQCLAAGMDDFLTKPIKIAEMTEVIRRRFGPAKPADA